MKNNISVCSSLIIEMALSNLKTAEYYLSLTPDAIGSLLESANGAEFPAPPEWMDPECIDHVFDNSYQWLTAMRVYAEAVEPHKLTDEDIYRFIEDNIVW